MTFQKNEPSLLLRHRRQLRNVIAARVVQHPTLIDRARVDLVPTRAQEALLRWNEPGDGGRIAGNRAARR